MHLPPKLGIEIEAGSPPLNIEVIGAAGTGKSDFMATATMRLQEVLPKYFGLESESRFGEERRLVEMSNLTALISPSFSKSVPEIADSYSIALFGGPAESRSQDVEHRRIKLSMENCE